MWAALLGRIPELIPDVKSKLICVSNTKKHHIIMLSRFFLRENFSENKSSRWKCLKYILLEKFCCPSSKIIQKKFIRKYFIYLFYLYKNYFCLFVFSPFATWLPILNPHIALPSVHLLSLSAFPGGTRGKL